MEFVETQFLKSIFRKLSADQQGNILPENETLDGDEFSALIQLPVTDCLAKCTAISKTIWTKCCHCYTLHCTANTIGQNKAIGCVS